MTIDNQIEVELRVEIDSDILETNGYLPSNKSTEHDTYYSYQSDPNRTWIARIRSKNGRYFLTFKSFKKFGNDVWDEVNINVSYKKAVQLNDFFLSNGFFIDVEIKKIRKTYKIDNMEINFDYIENLGTFIEAEIMSSKEHIDAAKTKIQDFFNSLNIEKDKIITKGYVPLMKERLYGKNS